MPELYIDPAAAFKSGYEATTKVGEDVAASATLRQAYDQAPTDPESATGDQKDMFKVNTIAAQMAARAGRTRVAEQFQKQAEVSKTNALQQQLDTIKVEEAKFDQFERTLESITTGEEGVAEVLKSKLPEDQKMNLASKFKAVGDDPAKLQTLKDQMRKQAMSAKDNVAAQRQLAEYELKVEKVRLDEVYRAKKLRQQAIGATTKETHAEKKAEKDADHMRTRVEKADDTLSAEKRRIRTLDPNKFSAADKAKLITEAEIEHEEAIAQLQPKETAKETPSKSNAPAVTSADQEKLISLNKDGKLTKGQKEEFDSHYGRGAADKILDGAKGASKAGAGQKTHDGYPARENADGSYSTEVSITVTNPKLNNGKPTNIPSLWKGKEVDEDTAVRNALATGKSYKSFNSIKEAVAAAKARSKAGGAGADSKKELTDEEQLAEDLSKATGVQERNAIRNDYNIRQDRKAKQAQQKAIAAKGKEKTEAAIAKAQKQGLVLSGMSGTQLKFVDPKTGKEVLESEL